MGMVDIPGIELLNCCASVLVLRLPWWSRAFDQAAQNISPSYCKTVRHEQARRYRPHKLFKFCWVVEIKQQQCTQNMFVDIFLGRNFLPVHV